LLWTRQNGKLLFVNFKESTGTFAFPELRAAYENGMIVHEVRKVVIFYESAPIFRGYVNTLYKKRLKAKESGDMGASFIYKRLLNSLYGKFAQKPERIRSRLSRLTRSSPGLTTARTCMTMMACITSGRRRSDRRASSCRTYPHI